MRQKLIGIPHSAKIIEINPIPDKLLSPLKYVRSRIVSYRNKTYRLLGEKPSTVKPEKRQQHRRSRRFWLLVHASRGLCNLSLPPWKRSPHELITIHMLWVEPTCVEFLHELTSFHMLHYTGGCTRNSTEPHEPKKKEPAKQPFRKITSKQKLIVTDLHKQWVIAELDKCPCKQSQMLLQEQIRCRKCKNGVLDNLMILSTQVIICGSAASVSFSFLL